MPYTYTPACNPPDKYDRSAQYLIEVANADPTLVEFRAAVHKAWNTPSMYKRAGGCLFQYVSPSGYTGLTSWGTACGCLTQVKAGAYPAETAELQRDIAADTRIPAKPVDVWPEHLAAFAEWQRRIDEALRIPRQKQRILENRMRETDGLPI